MNVLDGAAVSSHEGEIGYWPAESPGNVTVSGRTSQWIIDSELHVGRYGTGRMDILGAGAVFNTDGYVGSDVDRGLIGVGAVRVTDAQTKWVNSGDLYVGYEGIGTLDIESQALVYSRSGSIGDQIGSEGAVTVDGLFSTWNNSFGVDVGRQGTGTLTIRRGGKVYSDRGHLGRQVGSQGTVGVQGAGSSWANSGVLSVGFHGDGTLIVKAGGELSNTDGYIGHKGGSQGEVLVVGATWTNDGSLSIGRHGDGSLEIFDGGEVFSSSEVTVGHYGSGTLAIRGGGKLLNNDRGYVGRQSDSQGTVAVQGPGSSWANGGILSVGYYGNGTLIVEDDGQLSNTDGYIGYQTGSQGDVLVVGATWTNDGSLTIGHQGEGSLEIFDGGEVYSTYGFIGSFIPSSGTVRVADCGMWDISDDLFVGFGGPGLLDISDPGIVRVGGSATFWTFGTLKGVINGPPCPPKSAAAATSHGRKATLGEELINVTGDLVLEPGSTLTLRADGGLAAVGDATRTIITAAGIEGGFSSQPAIGSHLGHGVFHQDLRYVGTPTPTAVEIDVFQAAAGDVDGNRYLDGLDIQAILAAGTFPFPETGLNADWPTGDFTGDRICDGQDIQAILATGLWDPTSSDPYAAAESGQPGQPTVELIFDSSTGGLTIDTHDATINGYLISSRAGIFTGQGAHNLGFFQEDTDGRISGNLGFGLRGQRLVGDVIGLEFLGLDLYDDLTFTYTVEGQAGVFRGSLIPEPSTIVMLIGVVLMWLLAPARGKRRGQVPA